MTDIEIAVKEIVKEINKAAISRADKGLNILRNSALEVLSKETHGRSYKRGVASVPGATPNPQTGNLRRNWSQRKEIGGNVRITLKIKSRMFYADFLEHGTRKMAARPYREPIRKAAIPKIKALFSDL